MKKLFILLSVLILSASIAYALPKYSPAPSDETYGATWNGEDKRSATKNSIYDKIEAVIAVIWSTLVDSDIVPDTDDTYDFGTPSAQFKDGYFDGTLEADELTESGNAVLNTSEYDADTDPTADLEEETHASEHAVAAADTVFPADPDADRVLWWDDAPGSLLWKDFSNWDTAYTDRLKWDGGSTGLVAGTGRTSLGATTVGSNIFTVTNPGAIRFIRVNADNTVTLLSDSDYRTAIGAGTSSFDGAVTSLSATNWRIFYSGAGAIPIELVLGANGTFLESNGASAAPAFRVLEAGDIPDLSGTYVADADFTQNSGILVGTGAGTFQEETGATLRTSIGCDPAGTDNSTTNITVVEAPTNVDIQSSDGSNDTIAAADATNAGVMTKAMYDNHVLNNAKLSYPSYSAIYVDAEKMVACTTNPALAGTCEYGTNDIDWEYFAFDTGATEERVQFKLVMPPEWSGGTLKAKFYWSSPPDSSIGDTVEWGIKAQSLDDDDAIDCAFGTAVTVSDALLADAGADLQVTAATAALTVNGSPAEGDLVTFEIYRNTDGTDDMAEDAWLMGVSIQYSITSTAIAAW